MKYMGGKSRIAKHILQQIEKNVNVAEFDWWVEPFVGGGGMIDKVEWGNISRMGSDLSKECILALTYIKNIENEVDFPKNNQEFTEETYHEQKKQVKNGELTGLNCYTGYALSYGGQWYGGWCRDRKSRKGRDDIAEAYGAAKKQSKALQTVDLRIGSYLDLVIPEKSIVYCDIPYKSTTKYTTNSKNLFNYEQFYQWCIDNRTKHRIFVSEYFMPSEFVCIWEKEIASSLGKNTGAVQGLEKLYMIG